MAQTFIPIARYRASVVTNGGTTIQSIQNVRQEIRTVTSAKNLTDTTTKNLTNTTTRALSETIQADIGGTVSFKIVIPPQLPVLVPATIPQNPNTT